jgi:C1A family cysteine protease
MPSQHKLYNSNKGKVKKILYEGEREDLPLTVNWFSMGVVSSPYNQQSCGSCWAFTTAATLESLAVISGISKQLEEFSVQ